MTVRILRSDAPAVAQVTRLSPPGGAGEIALTIRGSGKFLRFTAWSATAIVAAWNAAPWPEFQEARASVNGSDVLLTSTVAGRPVYIAATVDGREFGNEIQTVTPVEVTGGTATATWLGQTTDPFDPTVTTAADLKDLFEALPGGIVAEDELTWTGPAGGPWTVEFGGRYAEQDVPLIVIDGSNLTGGIVAENELQRLVLAGGSTSEVSFQLRRKDTLETTDTLTTPVSAADVQTALAGISYTTTCTGGPLTASGSATDKEMNYFAGYYHGSTLVSFNQDGATLGYIGQVGDEQSIGLLQFAAAIAQGTTITSAILKPLFANGYDAIAGVMVKAEDVDNATWPANAAAAASATLTTAAAVFNITGGGPYAIDVTDVVQEVFDRPGWDVGHKLQFHLIPPATTHKAGMLMTAGGVSPFDRIYLEIITSGGQSITIEWTGGDAATDIPDLVVIADGAAYVGIAPRIIPVRDGHAAIDAALSVEVEVSGGEALAIRDDQRSRGPNHYDDPLNWEADDGSFLVLEDGDKAFVESGKVDLLYGLNQRSGVIALPALNKLRLTDVHHFWEGQAVRVITTGTLPGGLAADTTYYVRNIDGPYIQLSATREGNPIDLTDAGTGTHTLGVKLLSIEIQSRWSGKMGLPRQNSTGNKMYFEYRERYLQVWCDRIKIGTGDGGGSSRVNIDTGALVTALQAIDSAGQVETGVNAVLWRGVNADNTLEALGADVGIAIFPEESASFDTLLQRAGTVTLGRNVTGGSIDATGGTRNSLGAVIAGELILS